MVQIQMWLLLVTTLFCFYCYALDTYIIDTYGGAGSNSDTGDGGAATNANIATPTGLWADASDGLYVTTAAHVIRYITSDGIISKIAGTGTGTYSGEGGAATLAALNAPKSV